jgi:hypothetical protein
VEFIASILGLLGGSCDCLVTIFVIVGGVWFFVIREKSDADSISAAANTANKALDTVGAAFDDDEEDDVATIVAPQPKSASEEPKVKLARPPRSAGATIIAFDDDDLLDD